MGLPRLGVGHFHLSDPDTLRCTTLIVRRANDEYGRQTEGGGYYGDDS